MIDIKRYYKAYNSELLAIIDIFKYRYIVLSEKKQIPYYCEAWLYQSLDIYRTKDEEAE